MSEKRTEPLTDAELNYSPEEWAEALAEDPTCIRAYLAAAEERGRRAGIEERDVLLREALGVLRLWPSTEEFGREHARELCIRIAAVVYLAPRDSAPVCTCSGTASAVFYDGGHLPDCLVVAPAKARK